MDKVRIKIVKLGKQKHEQLFVKLSKYKSRIFTVDIYEQNRPECDYDWGYSFDKLKGLLATGYDSKKHDICIGFVDTIIEMNYFGKRLQDNNIYVVSFFQVDEMLKNENIDPFNFMLATIYRYVTRYKIQGRYLTHDETKGCIFDMCGDKTDIIYSCNKPIICDDCRVAIRQSGVESEYLPTITKEIKKIKKSNYYYISDFIKKHPYLSLFIGFITSIILNIISDVIYGLFIN